MIVVIILGFAFYMFYIYALHKFILEIDKRVKALEQLKDQKRQRGYTAKEMADIGQALGDGLRKGLGGS